jgi:hypothetical protein
VFLDGATNDEEEDGQDGGEDPIINCCGHVKWIFDKDTY